MGLKVDSCYSDTAQKNEKFVVSSGILTRIVGFLDRTLPIELSNQGQIPLETTNSSLFSAVSNYYESSFHISEDGSTITQYFPIHSSEMANQTVIISSMTCIRKRGC